MLVPTVMHRIWQLGESRIAEADVPSLEAIMHMAAACPAWLKQHFIDWLGADRVLEPYGGTEGYGITVIDGNEWLAHRGSVGVPAQDTRICDEQGHVLPAGAVGEVYFTSVTHSRCIATSVLKPKRAGLAAPWRHGLPRRGRLSVHR